MKYVGRQSDAKDVSSLNPSAATDTTLDGSESIGGWKGGFIRTTVAKICAWIVGQANTWTAEQTFNARVKGRAAGSDGTSSFYCETAGGTYASMWTRRGAPYYTNKSDSGSSYAPSLSMVYTHNGAYVGVYSVGVLNNNAGDPGAMAVHHIDAGGGANFSWLFSGLNGSFTAPGYVDGKGGMKLGELSPTLKVKVIDTTMAATAGDVKTVAHGVGARPLMVIPRVTDSGGSDTHPNSFFTTAQYGVSFDATNVYLRNSTGASANIVSRPVSIVIFYTA